MRKIEKGLFKIVSICVSVCLFVHTIAYATPTLRANLMFDESKRQQGIERTDDANEFLSRKDKEKILEEEIFEQWDKIRASRSGINAVLSTRYSTEQNIENTRKLQEDIFGILEGTLEGKRVFEVGVGIGRMTSEIAKRAKEIIGNDISPNMIQRATKNLKGFDNVSLHVGKITELGLSPKSFDLVFSSLVLIHIINPEELKQTIEKMKELSDRVFIVEQTYQDKGPPRSKYTIFRRREEYEQLFKPYNLTMQKEHIVSEQDTVTMMLFENPDQSQPTLTKDILLDNQKGLQKNL